MNKPLICTTVLMSAALVAGAAVDADNIYNRIFPEVKIVEYRREVRPSDTLWDTCGEIATDTADWRAANAAVAAFPRGHADVLRWEAAQAAPHPAPAAAAPHHHGGQP